MRGIKRTLGKNLVMAGLLPMFLLLGACDLEKLLEVEIPGNVIADDLNNPALAQTLVNGVIGDLECAWSNYTSAATHHSDEWMPASGNLNNREWGQRKMETTSSSGGQLAQGNCAATYGIYTTMQTARFQNNSVYGLLADFDAADVPAKSAMQGVVRAYGGYAMIGLGEGFCSGSLDNNGEPGPELTPEQVMDAAIAAFTEAISLSTDPQIVNMAYAGRARAKLRKQDWAGAIADAQVVPDGFRADASRDVSEDRRNNRIMRQLNDPNDGVSRHGSIATDYRDLTVNPAGDLTQSDGVPDTRVPVETIGEQSFDFSTIHWYTTKYTSRADAQPIASWEEQQLIIAEASAQLNDLPTAVAVIDDLRTRAGLPTWSAGGSATQDQVIQQVLDERRRQLFVGMGWRFNDMLRYRGTPFEIPFLGEPGSIHPDNLDQTGAEYGPVTCWELPLIETQGNPNIGG